MRHPLKALLIVLLVAACAGAATTRHTLMREDVSYVHPVEDEYGSTLTGATLQAAINAIGAAEKTVMLTPGTWAVSSDLTVPENVSLHVPKGALLSVGGGATLTLNGGLEAEMAQVFSGAGTVVLGRRVEAVHAQWFGAKFDDSTDDTAALQKALAATDASGNRTLQLPAGYARITSELAVPSDVNIRGEGRIQSGIRVIGAIRGLIYDGDVNFEQSAVFEHFSIYGDYTQTLDLLTITGQTWGVRVRDMRLRGTAENAIALDETVGVHIHDSEISEFVKSGVTSEDGFANRISIRNVRFEDYDAAHTVAAINCVGSSQWDIIGNSFESALSTSLSPLRLSGCANIAFEWNYAERYNHHLVVAHTALSRHISIRNNRMHTFAPHKLDFATDSLAHEFIFIENNNFDGVSDISNILLAGSTASLVFKGNDATIGNVPITPNEWVTGFPDFTETVVDLPTAVYVNGIAVGDWTRKLFLNGANDLRLENEADMSTITFRIGGTDVAVLQEENVTFVEDLTITEDAHVGGIVHIGDNDRQIRLIGDDLEFVNAINLSRMVFEVGGTDALILEEPIATFAGAVKLGSIAFASLGASDDGTTYYCTDCAKATPCAGSGSGAYAKRINGAWDCD